MNATLDLLGRIFLSFIFLYEAYDTIIYFQTTKEIMTLYGITWRQELLLYGTIVFLILGGLMILTGYRARFGAVLLLCYWLPATFIIHSFWNDPPDEQRMQGIFFMKNIAIAGGLLMVLANGVGKHSIRRLFATFRVPNT